MVGKADLDERVELKLDGVLKVAREPYTRLVGKVRLGLVALVPPLIQAAPGLQEIVENILDRVASNLQSSLERSLLADYSSWASGADPLPT